MPGRIAHYLAWFERRPPSARVNHIRLAEAMLEVALESQAETHPLHIPGDAIREADQLKELRQ